MDIKSVLEMVFGIILLGDVLMHASAFASVVTSISASYNKFVTSLEGR